MNASSNLFCILLTHRHGVSVGVIKQNKSHFMKNTLQETLKNYVELKSTIVKTHENFEYIYEENVFCGARALGKTAENLLNLYHFVLSHFKNETIQNVVVGIGPGSFTGLRLGCAFANGLHLSQKNQLYAAPTLLRSQFLSLLDNNEVLIKEFFNELGEYRELDDASGFVTFFDLFYASHQIHNGTVILSDTLVPLYGREPTPVLKLRKE